MRHFSGHRLACRVYHHKARSLTTLILQLSTMLTEIRTRLRIQALGVQASLRQPLVANSKWPHACCVWQPTSVLASNRVA